MKAVYKKIREMMIYKGVRGRAAHIFGVIMLVFLGLVLDVYKRQPFCMKETSFSDSVKLK